MLRMRYAAVPVVAAVRGMALGGGCEIALHCARRVAAMESYMGFVEVGVGLVPAGGGLTYVARRAAEMASAGNANVDLLKFLTDGFTSAAMAKVGTSAIETQQARLPARRRHRRRRTRTSCCTSRPRRSRRCTRAAGAPPLKALFPVAGRNAIATIKAQLVNMRDGGFISAHDFHIGALIAEVVCGGDVDAGSLVGEEYLMTMERKRFCGLLDAPEDAGTDHGHAAERQTRSQLKEHNMSSKQVQDAYIVAATRTPIGRSGRGYLPQHAARRPARRGRSRAR